MKYYSEIESDFFLPINNERNINHELDNSRLPQCFFYKYKELIGFIPKIKEMLQNFY